MAGQRQIKVVHISQVSKQACVARQHIGMGAWGVCEERLKSHHILIVTVTCNYIFSLQTTSGWQWSLIWTWRFALYNRRGILRRWYWERWINMPPQREIKPAAGLRHVCVGLLSHLAGFTKLKVGSICSSAVSLGSAWSAWLSLRACFCLSLLREGVTCRVHPVFSHCIANFISWVVLLNSTIRPLMKTYIDLHINMNGSCIFLSHNLTFFIIELYRLSFWCWRW